MPLTIRKKFSDQTGAPRLLVEEVTQHRPAGLTEIRVQVWKNKQYFDTPLAVASIDEDGNDGLTPEAIALAVWELVVSDAKTSGATRYRPVHGVRVDGGVRWHEGQPMPVTFDDDGTPHAGGNDEGSQTAAVIDMTRLAKQIADDAHSQHMITLRTLLPIVRELSSKRGEVDVKIAEIEARSREDELVHETRQAWAEVARGTLEKFAEPFGVNLADTFDDYVREATGVSSKPITARWEKLIADIPPEKLAALRELLGEEYYGMVERLSAATDEHEFCAIARAFTQRVGDDPRSEEIVTGSFAVLGPALGMRFSKLLKEATGQT